MNSPMMRAPSLPEGLPSAWLLDCEAFAEGIRPDPDLTITQWAESRRVLSAETSSEPGPWRTERVPYLREVMDVLSPSDPTQDVTFVAGTQVGKTEAGNNFIGFVIDWAPGPAMMVYPTSNTGKRSSRTRLAKMIDSTPSLRAKISERSRDKSNSASLKEFPGGVLAIAGANSAAELKAMPVRYLFEDEVDEYPDDVDGQGPADELAEKRTDTFTRKKIFRTSTPTRHKRSKIWRHWLKSDQRRYYVPCPHCSERQVLRWEQMRWDTRKAWEVVRADDGEIVEVAPGTDGASLRDTGEVLEVWYECMHCQAKIEEHHKTSMLAVGRWVAESPGPGRGAGFHLSALYSPLGWFSWRQAVEKRLEADRDPSGELLKTWTNTVAAEPYTEASESIDELALKQRAEPYKLGSVPMGGLFLTAFVDVQQRRLEVKVKAWGRGEESWLVDYQVIHGDTESAQPWEALDEYLERKFQHESGARLKIIAAGVDSGYRAQTVYDWCRMRRHRNVIATKGQSQTGKAVLGRPTKQDVDHHGKVVKGGVEVWPVGADTAKAKIYARLQITTPGPGCMHFPLGLPDEYFRGLTSERLVSRYHKGYLRTSWEKDAAERNEPLDLEVGCYAAAIYAGLTRVNWDRLEAAVRATASDLFAAADARAEERAGQDAAEAEPEAKADRADAAADAAPRAFATRRNWITGYR